MAFAVEWARGASQASSIHGALPSLMRPSPMCRYVKIVVQNWRRHISMRAAVLLSADGPLPRAAQQLPSACAHCCCMRACSQSTLEFAMMCDPLDASACCRPYPQISASPSYNLDNHANLLCCMIDVTCCIMRCNPYKSSPKHLIIVSAATTLPQRPSAACQPNRSAAKSELMSKTTHICYPVDPHRPTHVFANHVISYDPEDEVSVSTRP